MSSITKTFERVLPDKTVSLYERVMLMRHLFAYRYASSLLNSNMTVLDIGCGEGYGTFLISDNIKSIIGIDVDSQIINHANKKYASSNCTFLSYDGSKTIFEDESFDAVISFQVVEHVYDDQYYVKEIHRILKPGGFFVITTPNKTMRLLPLQKPWNKYHVKEYYPHEIKGLLETMFNQIKLFGIAAEPRIMDMEFHRINKAQRSLNIFSSIIPYSVTQFIKMLLNTLRNKFISINKNTISVENPSVENFYIIEDDVYKSLDLLAVCTKKITKH